MTFADFIKLLKHYLVLVLVIVLICTFAGGAFGYIKSKSSYEDVEASENFQTSSGQSMAKATIISSSQIGGVGGIAEAEADAWNQDNNDDYGDWLVLESERLRAQLEASTNTSSKKSVDSAPGSWLRSDFASDFTNSTIVETQTDNTSNTVLITAIGPNPQICINAVNEVAEKTDKLSHKLFDYSNQDSDNGILQLGRDNSVVIDSDHINIEIFKATKATPAYTLIDDNVLLSRNAKSTSSESSSTLKTIAKFLIVGFAGGVLIAFIIVLLLDFIRKPIRNADSIAETLEVPLLASPGTSNRQDILYANSLLAIGDDKSNIGIASIDDSSASAWIYSEINNANDDQRLHFKNIGSLGESGKAIMEAAQSDGIILCMREWKDSIPDLENAINEIRISKTNLIGIAVLNEK